MTESARCADPRRVRPERYGRLVDATDSATAALTAAADDAIRALVMHLSHEPNLTNRYDYRIDIPTRDGGTYPLIYRTDP